MSPNRQLYDSYRERLTYQGLSSFAKEQGESIGAMSFFRHYKKDHVLMKERPEYVPKLRLRIAVPAVPVVDALLSFKELEARKRKDDMPRVGD